MSNTTQAAPKLLIARMDAEKQLNSMLEQGVEIKSQKVKYPEDLVEARAAKLKWTQDLNDLLHGIFDNESVADECNTWVGKLLSEHDDFSMFVEQFYAEMNHRISRLQMVIKRLDKVPSALEAKGATAVETVEEAMEAATAAASAVASAAAGTVDAFAGLSAAAGIAPAPTMASPIRLTGAPAAVAPASIAPAPAPTPAPMPVPASKPTVLHRPASPKPVTPAIPKPTPTTAGRIARGLLVAHGNDGGSARAMADFLNGLGMQMSVVEPGTQTGKGVIEQLAHDHEAAFAVLVMTADQIDHVLTNNSDTISRTSLGLAYELGYCAGRMTSKRVIVMYTGGSEMMTDDLGIAYLPVDPNEGWQLRLARQLKRAGLEIDLNKLC